MPYDNYYDPSVASVSRPLQGYERHTLSDSSTRQLQAPYLDPHRAPQYEDQDPVYRGNTPQFYGTGPDQLHRRDLDPFDPTGQGRAGQRTYEEREALADQRIAGMNPSTLRGITEKGLDVFGEVAPLMQARGKKQLQQAVLDKVTGKMQLEATKKAVQLGMKQFNKASEGLKRAQLGVRLATQNPMLLSNSIPSSSTTVLSAIEKLEETDISNVDTMLDWLGRAFDSEGQDAIRSGASELTASQESLSGDIASVVLSVGKEMGRGQGDPAKAATRMASAIGGAKAGAAIGGAIGAATGPAAPVAAPVLSFIGGALGSVGGAMAGKKLAPAAGQMGAQEIARPEPGLGKKPTMDELMGGFGYG